MFRYTLLLILAATSVLHAADQPNILFILCDDLGYGDVGVFHQNERAARKDRHTPFFTTPHIDTMAGSGMKLLQHYCAAPVCAPSRASLLTGLTQGHANVRDTQFDKALADTLTLGSALKQAGYATAAIGKWGLQGNPKQAEDPKAIHPAGVAFPGWPAMPNSRGFDYFLGYARHKDGHYHYPVEDKIQVWENQTEISQGLELCYTADLFTAAAKKWIAQHQSGKPAQPFFLYLAFDTPHARLQNPPCAYPAGGGLKGGVQWTGKQGALLNTANGKYDGWMHPDYAEATWDHDGNPETPEVPWPDVQKRYANDVRRIDDCVGDLLTLLDDLKIADNTLIVFTSDNGPSAESYLPEAFKPTFFQGYAHFEGIKRDILEGGMREPTIVRWPAKIRAGSSSSKPSGHWDWLATFAEAAGLPAPASTDGVSLLPTLTGNNQTPQEPSTLYSEFLSEGRTPNYPEFDPVHRGKTREQTQIVFVDGFKGLRTGIKSADDDFEIYDVTKDPKELHNLAKEEGFDKIQQRMKARALQARIPNTSAPRPYDNAPIPALETEPEGLGAMLNVKSGTFPWMPVIREDAFFPTPGFVIPDTHKPPYALKIEAAVQIPADGNYTFSVSSDSHTMLFVHDIRLLDENKEPTAEARTGTLNLKAGWHPVKLLYRCEKGSPRIAVKLTGPDGKEIPLSGKALKGLKLAW